MGAAPESLTTARSLDADILSQTADVVPLKHQLVAVIVRDPQRRRSSRPQVIPEVSPASEDTLNPEHDLEFRRWLAAQRPAAYTA
jgi:hypothetical protein